MLEISILLVNGIAVGGLYSLLAMGLVIVFKGSGIVNFAHGALFTISAYAAHTLLNLGFSYFFINFVCNYHYYTYWNGY